MDRYINLADPESRALAAGASVLIVPIMPQPDHCHRDIIGKPKPWSEEDWNRLLPQIGDKQLAAPFAPGDILHAREAWAENCDEYGTEVIQYRAGGYLIHGATGDRRDGSWRDEVFTGEAGEIDKPERWCSASQMPAWAVRHKYPVNSISAIRVSEIGEEDARLCGFDPWFPASEQLKPHVREGGSYRNAVRSFWQSRYPKLPWESWAWRVEVER